MDEETTCPFCGGSHERAFYGGPPVWACQKVPEGFVYVDVEYETGPRGALIRPEEMGRLRPDGSLG